ncbi:TPA: hypothetical protein HA235_06085 [Candidatus Woesearchaeota archaeon]|nr:hypothetical protein [Candidatus Woesearchaeota archaeon]HIH32249.1 hypothetical protein [Candidatus Woesearchaeota archaeon]HIH54793.1 hypothetical protein [Candidatus Woesearchaeota archaeon]HIJ14419.1 hypothetical protein [Candidatus Woesearchaeota archaeon]
MQNVPVFVKIDNYKEVLNIIDVMKKKIKDTKQSLAKIRELKAQEEQEIIEWERNVNEITKRLVFIDAAFFDND